MKKEVIKCILTILTSIITALATLFGVSSCSSLDFECSGSWCVKRLK